MSQCWKCSAELSGDRCDHCHAVNFYNGMAINGVIRDDEEVTIYVVQENPGYLVIDLGKRQGRLSQLPRPDKRGALNSKAFKQIWSGAVGDHPLLQSAVPQRYEVRGEKGSRLLFVEAHGMVAQPAPRTANGVPPEEPATLPPEESVEMPDPDEPQETGGREEPPTVIQEFPADPQEMLAAAKAAHEAQKAKAQEPVSGVQEAPESMVEETPEEVEQEVTEQAPEEAAEDPSTTQEVPEDEVAAAASQDAAAQPEPMAAAPEEARVEEDCSSLPGMELAVLPQMGVVDSAARLAKLREEIGLLTQDGKNAEALEKIGAQLAIPDSTRRLVENLYLHLTLGQLSAAQGDTERAGEALAHAFKLDPRDMGVLKSYSAHLSAAGDQDTGMKVDLNLLLHHRRQLDAHGLSGVYHRLGLGYKSQGDLERAKGAFEQALEARSDNGDALNGLLETVKEQGDIEQVIRIRQRLLDQMQDPKGRAMLRLSIGDDYHERLGDLERAMEQYEMAADEHPNTAALGRLAKLAMQASQWKRATSAYLRMADVLEENEGKAKAHVQAAAIFQHHLGAWEQAAAQYERAIELNFADLSPLEDLVSMLVSGERWRALRDVYTRMIDRAAKQPEPPKELIVVLLHKLGEVCRLHLEDMDGARKAYSKACQLQPNNAELRTLLAKLYDGVDGEEAGRQSIAHNRWLMAHSEDFDAEAVERLGMAHLRLKELDEALCAFRVLTFKGQGNEQIEGFVASNTSPVFKSIEETFNNDFYKSNLLGKGYNADLGTVFEIAGEAMIMELNHDPDHYKLKGRDRIDKNEDLMFTKLYRQIGAQLGFTKLPVVYHHKRFKGIFNAALHPPGFIVGADILSGCTEKQLSFAIAKQLCLMRPESELFQLYPLQHVNIFFHIILKTLNPNHKIELNKDMKKLSVAITKLKPERRKIMGEALVTLAKTNAVDIPGQQRVFEDAANKCGLLFCDDLQACHDMLAAEPRPVGGKERSVEDRMEVLMRWSLTSQYQQLRKQLGQAIG